MSGDWIPVPVREDAFVVNIGDMVQLWTNQRYKGISLPFFYSIFFQPLGTE
jgi:isopenicillin N synthase-like dioxygenase